MLIDVLFFLKNWSIHCFLVHVHRGENVYFKKLAHIGNFKNVAYSISKRHQRLVIQPMVQQEVIVRL